MSKAVKEIPLKSDQNSHAHGIVFKAKWAKSDLSAGSLRNWLVKKERFFLTRLAGKNGRVLDLGCGGGWRLFTRIGPVVGVDVSQLSLQSATGLYSGAVLASLTALPFADECFDYIVSLDVLGHIPLESKDLALREIRRVLKTGGHTLHYIETEGDDPLTRFSKRSPELYQRYIVKPEGHIGLEPAPLAAERFRKLGFHPLKESPVYKMLLYTSRVVQYFDNEYRGLSRPVAFLTSFCKLCVALGPVDLLANLIVSLALEVTDHLLPQTWASGLLVEYQKQEI